MATIWQAELETRNFTFTCYGTTCEEAMDQLIVGLDKHREQYALEANWYERDFIITREFDIGVALRDNEVFYASDLRSTDAFDFFKALGWEVVGTGGGCEAMTKQIDFYHYLATEADDPSAPSAWKDGVDIGLYHNEEGGCEGWISIIHNRRDDESSMFTVMHNSGEGDASKLLARDISVDELKAGLTSGAFLPKVAA